MFKSTSPDVAIVGGGSAACVLAARLSEDQNRRVVMLEAGPDFPDPAHTPAMVRFGWGGSSSFADEHSDLDWGYLASATAVNGEIKLPRGKLVGGSGSVNGQIFLRGLPEDIAAWSDIAGNGIDWLTMDAAYRALEAEGLFRIRRWASSSWVDTQAAFVNSCVAAGYGVATNHNSPYAMGAGPLPFNQDGQIRWSPPLAYLTPAVRARPNLHIMPRTVAYRIELRGNRAIAVTVHQGGTTKRITAGEIIIAAGAIGSPHLLLHSGIGPADELKALGVTPVINLPGVGRNLRDHPKCWVQWKLHDKVTIEDQVPGLQTAVRYTATGSPNRGDMMLYPNSIIPGPAKGDRAFRIEVVNNLELSSGTIKLKSPLWPIAPEINLNFFHESIDRERLIDGIHRTIDLGRQQPLADQIGEQLLPPKKISDSPTALNAWIDQTVMTGHHVSSTCRMGRDDDPQAVVNSSGCVHGLTGIRVIDASVMPDSVRANIHATVLALAEVIASRIQNGQ